MTAPDVLELRRLAAERRAALRARIDRVLSVFTLGTELDEREVEGYARLRRGQGRAPLGTLEREGRIVSRKAARMGGRAKVYRLAGTPVPGAPPSIAQASESAALRAQADERRARTEAQNARAVEAVTALGSVTIAVYAERARVSRSLATHVLQRLTVAGALSERLERDENGRVVRVWRLAREARVA